MSKKNNYSRKSNLVDEKLSYTWKWRTYIESIALGRFKWHNLPKTCNERFLERTLFFEGQAVFFELEGIPMATRVQTTGRFNVYDEINEYNSIGNNGWFKKIPEGEGVMIYNSLTRKNKLSSIYLYAEELAEIDLTARANRRQQRNLVILTGPEESARDLDILMNDLEIGNYARIALNSLSDNVSVNAIKLDIPYLADKFQEDRNNVMNQVYSYLGIANIPFEKGERLVSAEASIYTDPISRIREDALAPRIKACEEINEKFGLNVSVEWNTNEQLDILQLGSDINNEDDTPSKEEEEEND